MEGRFFWLFLESLEISPQRVFPLGRRKRTLPLSISVAAASKVLPEVVVQCLNSGMSESRVLLPESFVAGSFATELPPTTSAFVRVFRNARTDFDMSLFRVA